VNYYITIEKKLDNFEQYKQLWLMRGISGIRADSMTEGIEKAVEIEASKTNNLYFIAIVADDIVFLPQLSILREQIYAPIFIATSKPDAVERMEALNKGANYYGEYCETPELNIETVVSKIRSIEMSCKKPSVKRPPLILCRGVLLSPSRRVVFIKDKKIKLVGKEFAILQYLMSNSGQFLTHTQILRRVWGNEYNDSGSGILYQTINRIRNALSDVSPDNEYIAMEREIGYKFLD